MEAGVSSSAISVIPDEEKALPAALAMAGAGDLVLAFADQIDRCWEQITSFKPGEAVQAAKKKKSAVPFDLASMPEVSLGSQRQIVRDERGVRFARPAELED